MKNAAYDTTFRCAICVHRPVRLQRAKFRRPRLALARHRARCVGIFYRSSVQAGDPDPEIRNFSYKSEPCNAWHESC